MSVRDFLTRRYRTYDELIPHLRGFLQFVSMTQKTSTSEGQGLNQAVTPRRRHRRTTLYYERNVAEKVSKYIDKIACTFESLYSKHEHTGTILNTLHTVRNLFQRKRPPSCL